MRVVLRRNSFNNIFIVFIKLKNCPIVQIHTFIVFVRRKPITWSYHDFLFVVTKIRSPPTETAIRHYKMLAHVHQPERFVIRNIHFYVCYRMIKVHICFYPLDVIRENNYVTIWMFIKDMINTSIVVRFITMQKTTTNIITSSNMDTNGMWFIYFFKKLGTLYRNLSFQSLYLLLVDYQYYTLETVEKWQYRFYIDTKRMIFNVFNFHLYQIVHISRRKPVGNEEFSLPTGLSVFYL